ncbi:MAG: dihydropteroate synthase [Candidatus Marinimicrobia bacterium CG08_land_8_20_14_0_20_45_22]|nr:MAG: dihydropteroate synthase [Candidatus Marinimicrobia bacterium CG08_land_8_20_14_0_20_45_22]
MESLPADPEGIQIMVPKGDFHIFKIPNLSLPAANILKQQMLSIGGECAVSKHASTCSVDQAPAILMGTKKQFVRLIESLKNQPFGLKTVSEELTKQFESIESTRLLRIGKIEFDFAKRTGIMGILNVTPDSFSDGGKFTQPDVAADASLKMIDDGADIIDIGGESTRPGAAKVDLQTELNRVLPVIDRIRARTTVPISIDTYKSKVAEEALDHGVTMVNDISGLTFDPDMAAVIAKHNASVSLMHIQGKPENMQKNPHYENIIDEILESLRKSVAVACNAGIPNDRILVDPGFGFGKIYEDNLFLLRYLSEFKSLGYPILIGVSRKTFTGKALNLPVTERMETSLAALCSGILRGANVVRVHDVKASYRAVRFLEEILGKK